MIATLNMIHQGGRQDVLNHDAQQQALDRGAEEGDHWVDDGGVMSGKSRGLAVVVVRGWQRFSQEIVSRGFQFAECCCCATMPAHLMMIF